MPLIRFSASKCRAFLAASISLDREIISFCSYYTKKGLVYIIITDSFSCQFSSYIKYTKLNTYALYNIRSVSFNKCAFPTYSTSF